jgi:hypothetical protein
MDRSKLPVTRGIIAARARIARIDWVDRMEEMLFSVGKVSGRASEKAANISTVSASRP